ncbi:hypothetical protein [Luteolibacter sp. Populi]|uniref:hypothetical protein n=1 Tax=Luteolibacter sp. Populi TaxID=3230487 RepID=UPI0034672103
MKEIQRLLVLGFTIPAFLTCLSAEEPAVEVAEASKMPTLAIKPEDVLQSETQQLEDRSITIERVSPIELPAVPEPAAAPEPTPEDLERWQQLRENMPQTTLLSVGATIYHAAALNGEARTLLLVRDQQDGKYFKCWSSADWRLFSGGNAQLEIEGRRYGLMMFPSTVDLDRWAQLYASRGLVFVAPVFPEIPAGNASFVVSEGNPTPEALEAITAFHQHYNSHLQEMRTAFQARELAQQQAAEKLRNNPVQPKNIVIRHWRMDAAGLQGETPKPAVAR